MRHAEEKTAGLRRLMAVLAGPCAIAVTLLMGLGVLPARSGRRRCCRPNSSLGSGCRPQPDLDRIAARRHHRRYRGVRRARSRSGSGGGGCALGLREWRRWRRHHLPRLQVNYGRRTNANAFKLCHRGRAAPDLSDIPDMRIEFLNEAGASDLSVGAGRQRRGRAAGRRRGG